MLGRLGFDLHFGLASHHGLVSEADRAALAEMYAGDAREALEVMTTRYEKAA